VLTGAHGPRADLLRLVEGPDGAVWPDLGARLPGRGAWVSVDGPAFQRALASGQLARALARAWRKPPPVVPADLAERVEAGLAARALDRLGLEHRAGRLLLGSDRIEAAARMGRVKLLIHAADAARDGCARLDQALRAGSEDGVGGQVMVAPAARERLSRALGRDNSVHIGISDGKAAARVRDDLARWISWRRPDADNPRAHPAPGEDEGQA
jgi:predicted RNA-binding protein YlxR (DUF448 family)